MEFWPDISVAETAAIAAVAFFAGVMRGFSGFGSALMIVPVASAFLGPQIAVPVVTAVHLVTSAQLLPRALRDVEWGRVAPLSLAGCVTIPIGAWVLTTEDPDAIRKGISVLIIFFAFMMMRAGAILAGSTAGSWARSGLSVVLSRGQRLSAGRLS